jgi:hypothetical protein
VEEILREVAFVAYHFHWSREEICAMPHPERRGWVDEISRLNRAASGED